jgi:hypothetical protein
VLDELFLDRGLDLMDEVFVTLPALDDHCRLRLPGSVPPRGSFSLSPLDWRKVSRTLARRTYAPVIRGGVFALDHPGRFCDAM